MLEVYWICDVCGEDVWQEHRQLEVLKLMVLPKGWLWVNDKGYCDKCRRYANVSDGK